MVYRILAEFVVAVHFVFILWVTLGWIAVRFRHWLIWLHLPAAIWGVAIELLDWACPLTPLEQQLRHWAGAEGYEGGFIEHYLRAIIYPEGMHREVEILLGVAVFVVNVGGYWWIRRSARNEHRNRGRR